MNETISFQRFFDLLARRWKLFAVVAMLAVVAGVLISSPLIMKPRFRSSSTVYPVNLNSYSIETRTAPLEVMTDRSAHRRR